MKHKKSTYYIIGAVLVATLIALILLLYKFYTGYVYESELYNIVSPYMSDNSEWVIPEDISYEDGSGEALFLQGMNAFISEDYETAKSIFEQALNADHSDPALTAYLYYYINECYYKLSGTGDYDTVSKAYDAAALYHPLANDRNMLWNLAASVSMLGSGGTPDPEADQKTIALMENYLENTENLEMETWGRMKNCIALLDYMNQEYSKSIRTFYDVEFELSRVEQTPEITVELTYAQEYIANIYYIFEDYDRTIQLYQELISDTAGDEEPALYSYYINMSTAYIELGDLENARKTAETLNDVILPQLDEETAKEVNASNSGVLADICIEEGRLEEANSYLITAEEFYKNNEEQIFYTGGYHVFLSRSKYFVRSGRYEEALAILETMKEEGMADYYGVEKDLHELLIEVYENTEQNDKLIATYDYLLQLDKESTKTTQREYLEFSEYYRDVKHLESSNLELSRTNVITTLLVFIVTITLIIVLWFIRLLRTKNITDQLTGVYNRKKLNMLLNKYSSGTPEKLGIAMMDIDFFKKYNDSLGHPAGDAILKEVAQIISESVRNKDIIIRYGGEEFLAVLTDVEAQTALEICERINKRLAERNIPHPDSSAASYVSLSMGLCHRENAGTETLEELIEYADECLYTSKEEGRNRVVIKEIK